jgi:hypothetical protein
LKEREVGRMREIVIEASVGVGDGDLRREEVVGKTSCISLTTPTSFSLEEGLVRIAIQWP